MDIEEEQPEEMSPENYIFFRGGRVSKILDERIRSGTKEIERLCKFQAKSYLHLEWITEKEANQREIQMARHTSHHRANI